MLYHIKISSIKRKERNKEIKEKAINAGLEFVKEHKTEIISYGLKIAAGIIIGEDIKDLLIGFVKRV